jgi:hypothetical protein
MTKKIICAYLPRLQRSATPQQYQQQSQLIKQHSTPQMAHHSDNIKDDDP